MTRYYVLTDIQNEERKGSTDWTQADMIAAYWRKDSRFEEVVAGFDTLEEARERFEEEKKYCDSRYQKGQIGWLVLFDWLALAEVDEDEDGEWNGADFIDEYVAPIGD